MAHEPEVVNAEDTVWAGMTNAQLLEWMGTNAAQWTQAFMSMHPNGSDADTMMGWFANAIENGRRANQRLVWMGDRPLTVNGPKDRLALILELQREFQEKILGHGDLSALEPKARADYFRTQGFSLVAELVEASNEIAWKPWATSTHFNTKSYSSEIIDMLHFVVNLALLADMSADELFDGYLKKQARNRERQTEGYDGVTGKCPSCRRSYDDAGVLCKPRATPESRPWCGIDGEYVL